MLAQPQARRQLKKRTEEASYSARTDYEKAVQSPQKGNLYPEVLLACALAEKTDMGFFTAAAVGYPLRQILKGDDIDIPSYARHLDNFSTAERANVLEKRGPKHLSRFRFRDPLVQQFVVLRACADGLIAPRRGRSRSYPRVD